MSIRLMTAIWDSGHYEQGTLLTLLALGDWAHDDGTHIFPHVSTLAKKARLSDRQVQRVLIRLKKDGIIEPVTEKKGPGRATGYRINLQLLKGWVDEVQSRPKEDATKLHPLTPIGSGDATNPPNGLGDILADEQVLPSTPDVTHTGSDGEGCQNVVVASDVIDGCRGRPLKGDASVTLKGDIGGVSPEPPYIDNHHKITTIEPLSHPPSAGAREPDQVIEPTRVTAEIPGFLRRFPDEFNRFIGAYPSTGEGPDETFKAWKASEKIRPAIDVLLASVGRYVARMVDENQSRPADNQRQACHPSKWLREKRWVSYAPLPERPKIEGDAEARARARRAAWGGHPAAEKLCVEVGEGVFDTWFAVCRLSAIDGMPILHAPSRLTRDMLATKHMDRLEAAFGTPVVLELNEAKLVAA